MIQTSKFHATMTKAELIAALVRIGIIIPTVTEMRKMRKEELERMLRLHHEAS